MHIEEFDDFRGPGRGPWLLVIVVVLAAIVTVRMIRGPGKNRNEAEKSPPVVEERVAVQGGALDEATGSQRTTRPVPSGNVADLLKEAMALEEADRLQDARVQYLSILGMALKPSERRQVETRLGVVHLLLLETPRLMPEKIEHVVKPGESLERIARRLGTTEDLIQESNGVSNPNRIKAGDVLRVFSGEFHVEVSKSRNDMVVQLNGEFFKRYLVGTGRYGKTPVGTFKITERIKEPVWWRPDGKEVPFGDPENILGTRWMTLRATGETPPVRGYGVHGTWESDTVGKAESAGCVRMRNQDVEELFRFLPIGTTVAIQE